MNNLFPAPMLFALLVFPQNLSAQSATHCPMTADDANCVRVVACIGDEGVWFNGRAFGRGEGTFSGTTSMGLMCEGTWMSRNAFGLGQADVMCEDGARDVYFIPIKMSTQAQRWDRARCILGKRSKFGRAQMCWNICAGTQPNGLPTSPVMGVPF
jgi:hypothetical protein